MTSNKVDADLMRHYRDVLKDPPDGHDSQLSLDEISIELWRFVIAHSAVYFKQSTDGTSADPPLKKFEWMGKFKPSEVITALEQLRSQGFSDSEMKAAVDVIHRIKNRLANRRRAKKKMTF